MIKQYSTIDSNYNKSLSIKFTCKMHDNDNSHKNKLVKHKPQKINYAPLLPLPLTIVCLDSFHYFYRTRTKTTIPGSWPFELPRLEAPTSHPVTFVQRSS